MTLPLKLYWELLSRHIRPQMGRFLILMALMLVGIGLQIINPQIMRSFIDSALAKVALGRLMQAALIFIAIALLQQVVSVGVTYLGQSVAWTATNALRAELARHCLDLDMSFHNDHSPGQLISRIDGDVAELSNFFSQFVVVLLSNLLLMVGILIVSFFTDWRAGIAFTVFTILSLYALVRVRDLAIAHQKDSREANAQLFGFIEEQLAGVEDIRSSGAVGFVLRELQRLSAVLFRHDRKTAFKEMIMNIVIAGMITLGNIMSVGVGYWLFTAGAITVGMVYLLIHYINLIEGPLWTMTHQIQNFQTIGACAERLIELRKVQPRVVDGEGLSLPGGALPLSFEHVSFHYEADEPVLNEVTFRLQPGKILGLLGRTGSGKTTLARLVFRFYDPVDGSVQLNNTDIRQARLVELRRRVALVTQDVQLFEATVRDNLTFFDHSVSDERIHAVIAELGLEDWFADLPAGLETRLEQGSHSISAGEAQLLALTRVFLRNPGLVILDEASSRLDPATEQRLERAIDRLLQGRTAIIIAHRLGTVQRANEIMILDDGRMCEYGDRVDLAADPASHFYRLLQTGLEEVLA
jgi:ATP-binding cassette subfamily B protein